MKSWTDWEVIRRQVAIAGRIVDDGNIPVRKVEVKAVATPAPRSRHNRPHGGARDAVVDREEKHWDAVHFRERGIYFFLDLPEGSYTVSAADPRTGKRGQSGAKVAVDEEGGITMARTDIRLSAQQNR